MENLHFTFNKAWLIITFSLLLRSLAVLGLVTIWTYKLEKCSRITILEKTYSQFIPLAWLTLSKTHSNTKGLAWLTLSKIHSNTKGLWFYIPLRLRKDIMLCQLVLELQNIAFFMIVFWKFNSKPENVHSFIHIVYKTFHLFLLVEVFSCTLNKKITRSHLQKKKPH